jgi:ABC-type phosphate transport system substrate-binding protein
MSSGIPSGGWSTTPLLTPYAISRDGIVFIVHTSVIGIDNMTQAQIANIYNGTTTNWNQITDPITSVVGPNIAIHPRARIIGSGTRASFKDSVGAADTAPAADKITYSNPDQDPTTGTAPAAPMAENWVMYKQGFTAFPREESNQTMHDDINSASATGQCGYVGLGFDQGTNLKAINIVKNGVAYAPTGPNIYAGTYPFARFLWLVKANDWSPANATSDVQNYIDWIRQLDGAGQQAVKDEGFLKLVPDQDLKIDSNNVINGQDMAQVAGHVGESGASAHWIRADVKQDANNVINGQDLAQVAGWIGTTILPVP